ncbi:MAG: winged helix-turn-helix domain-containing protein [Oscillospiraceae bacterium]|nr:winged helix-turn-helix domain-containing protein [Oscillospiraceae bacterium]
MQSFCYQVTPKELARALNIHRRQINQETKREIIRQQLMETPEKSDNSIAKQLGVCQPTVSGIRKRLEESGEVVNFITSTGADGKEYPRTPKKKPLAFYDPPFPEVIEANGCEEYSTLMNKLA